MDKITLVSRTDSLTNPVAVPASSSRPTIPTLALASNSELTLTTQPQRPTTVYHAAAVRPSAYCGSSIAVARQRLPVTAPLPVARALGSGILPRAPARTSAGAAAALSRTSQHRQYMALLRTSSADDGGLKAADKPAAKLHALKALLMQAQSGIRLDLSGVQLNDLDMRKFDFSDVDLRNAIVRNCQLSGAIFAHALMKNCQLIDCNADGARLKQADLRGATLRNTSLNDAGLEQTQLSESQLYQVSLQGADATCANFSGALLQNCVLDGTILHHASFNGTTFSGPLQGADLQRTSMRAVTIAGADFRGVSIPHDLSLALPPHSDRGAQARYLQQFSPLALLKAIDSLDDPQWPWLRVSLARQLSGALSALPASNDAEALLDILAKIPYRDDERISAFITSRFSARTAAANPLRLTPAQLDKAVRPLPPEQRSAVYLAWLRAKNPPCNRIMEEQFNYERKQVLNYLLMEPRNGKVLDLRGVDLRGIKIKERNLQYVDLSWADLRNTQFISCTFNNAKLRSALMQHCLLHTCTFAENSSLQAADLHMANITGSNMSGIHAPHIRLSRVSLDHVDLNLADLSYADLSEAYATDCIMKQTNLTCGNLQSITLRDSVLNESCLQQASMENAELFSVELYGADMSTAGMSRLQINCCNLQSTKLNNTLTFMLPEVWDGTNLDLHLNHFHHLSGSLLTTLNSINAEYAELKIRLAQQLVDSLSDSGADLHSVSRPLIDVLGQSFWRGNPRIDAFISPLIRQYLAGYNHHVMPPLRPSLIQATLGEFARDPHLALARDHHHAFIQLIDRSIYDNQAQAELRTEAIAAYNTYLQQPSIRQLFRLPAFVNAFGDNLGQADWSDASGREAQNYLLLPNGTHGPMMLLSSTHLQSMLAPDANTSWSHYYLFRDGQVLAHADYEPHTLFAHHFPLFTQSYLAQQYNDKFWKLLSSLKLGPELHQLFLDARQEPASSRKLISLRAGLMLEKAFSPLLQLAEPANSRQYHLTGDHYQTILEHYQLTDASDRDKAATLLSLTTVFVRYSSSTLFGGDEESPEWVRYWAYAAMAEAYRLDPSLFQGRDRQMFGDGIVDLFPLWQGRLLGEPGHFSCTNTLADNMLPQLRDKCPQILSAIYPATWS